MILMLAAWARGREGAGVWVEVSSGRSELAEAIGAVRPSEGRFTGGFDYAPFDSSFHSPPRTQKLNLVLREINRNARRSPAPELVKDLAVLRLAAGDVKEALRLLEEQAHRYPQRADIQSDLAAVWLARSRISGDPFDFIKALDAADRAVRLNSALPEAWFNLAIAAESLFLPTTVVRAWVSYLSLDEGSSWAWEARARLAKARGPTERQLWSEQRLRLEHAVSRKIDKDLDEAVRRFTLLTRIWTEDELLPRWARAELEKKGAKAEQLLSTIRRLAAQHERVTGDAMLWESVEAIDSAHGSGRGKLALGHYLYGEGRQAHARHDTEKAEELFLQASGFLKQGNSPFALWSDLSIAVCRHEKRDSEEALARLDGLIRQIDLDRHRALAARSHWIRGLVQFAKSEPTLSLQEFKKALDLLKRSNAPEDEGAIHYLIASNLSYLGNREVAWQHLYKALAAMPRTVQERRLFTAYDEAGTVLAKAGEPRASLYFRDEVIALSRAIQELDLIGLGHAYLRRAESRFQAGDTTRAKTDLRRARGFAERIGSASFRKAVIAEIDVAEGEIAVATSPGRALYFFDSALAYYLRFGAYYDLPRIYLGRYSALMEAGQVEEAADDLAEGIEQYELVRERVGDETSRVSYFDQAQQLFELMVKLQVEAGRPKTALEYAERERARNLLDLRANARGLRPIGAHPLQADELAIRLPKGVTLVEYVSLPDYLLAWVIREKKIAHFKLNVKLQDLNGWVQSVREDLILGHHQRSIGKLEDLYDSIMRPLASDFGEGKLLVIVPDKALFGLPFAALRDRATGRYLVESRAVSISPSASFYVEGLSLEGSGGVLDSVLAVGASEFDRVAFSRISSLREVESEATAVAGVYHKATLLLGAEATKRRFVAEAGRHEVIHFAGHTLSVPESPLSSMMLFSSSGSGDSGALHASDIYHLDLKQARVVILFSCSTGLSQVGNSDGRLGLVRPFLARGIGTVVAALWDVRDQRAIDLGVAFHRQLKVHRNPVRALSEAQECLIRSSDRSLSSPSTWAVLQAFGTAMIKSDVVQQKVTSRMHLAAGTLIDQACESEEGLQE